jgi:tetratricopeptide repeat protein 8
MSTVIFFQGIGDLTLAYQSFRLALASNNDHAEAYNNLGVLEMRKGRLEMVSYPS